MRIPKTPPKFSDLVHEVDWNSIDPLLMRARATKDYRDFDPLPSAFMGRKR